MDTLIREGNPPAGQLASPVPQVWDPTANGGAGGWVRVYGEHHASRAILYGPNGQPISTANRLPVEATLSGSSTPIPARTELETIINAQSVAPGSSAIASVSVNGESEIWALVSIDRQPWTLMAGTAWVSSAGWGPRPWYPERRDRTTTPSITNPEISLYMPLSPVSPSLGLTAPQTMAEVRQYLIPPRPFSLGVQNNSGDVATVTVRLLRVWR